MRSSTVLSLPGLGNPTFLTSLAPSCLCHQSFLYLKTLSLETISRKIFLVLCSFVMIYPSPRARSAGFVGIGVRVRDIRYRKGTTRKFLGQNSID